ncbi:hypothetical protein E4T66_19020 [Sinimarinibacterium sp. CAU 1509]|uniref:Slp family lipoprotein n=1 Tax=Sinimarinibacterium sp. CAU 1509 TaxID=2562283 RepID=UPI0010AD3245|nr:Slp family lipoprotein [Sinimarinibacterium sp. CAU 1509]TJY56656.1 hypothetical protein E4T66_19020 [Sinimarinibacterium sp. CAU 1509]
MLTRRLPILLTGLILSACATPEALRGDFPDTTPAQISSQATSPDAGSKVRWGGTILSMENAADGSCFEILSRPLDSSGKPKSTDEELGRFLTCASDFKDPEIYKPGRIVTVIGTVTGTEKRKVGEFEYTYPKLAAEYIHLWKKESDTPRTYIVDPFWPPYGFYPYYYRVYYVSPPPGTDPQAPVAAQSGAAISQPTKRLQMPSGGVNLPARPLGGLGGR